MCMQCHGHGGLLGSLNTVVQQNLNLFAFGSFRQSVCKKKAEWVAFRFRSRSHTHTHTVASKQLQSYDKSGIPIFRDPSFSEAPYSTSINFLLAHTPSVPLPPRPLSPMRLLRPVSSSGG